MADLPQLIAATQDEASIECDALVVAAFSGAETFSLDETAATLDGLLEGRMAHFLTASSFKGGLGEMVVMPAGDPIRASSIAVVGLGDRDRVDAAAIRRAAGVAARRLAERTTLGVAIHRSFPGTVGAAAEGFALGSYRFTAYKNEAKPSKLQRLLFIEGDESVLERAAIVADATCLARDLTNEPASTLTPDVLAERARAAGEACGFRTTVWTEVELREHGFGGLLGVSAGSDVPPRFIQMHYESQDAAGKIALVGKGVTFDSGGLSLKDATNMETMKTDMGGAAAVIGTMSAISRLKPSTEVIAFVPATENMPSGTAVKPGDVLKHYGGKTTEVLNTDAEGRLILADALAFASEQKPDAIVDVATLTGSIMVALGKRATGLFANDDSLADELSAASQAAGERFWHMPLYDMYRKELESDVADMKNVGSRWGGAIIAALFLREFVGEGIPWAHLDIAGAARADSDHDENSKGGTGAAVRTLVTWIEQRAR